MKSERRHDLETNELAIQMQDFLDRVKPYASQIALVIVGLVALAYIGRIWTNASSATESSAWDEYTLASYSSDPELRSMKLLAENEEFAGTGVPEWAYLAWADRQVLLASQTYLTDRNATTKRLEDAQGVFSSLADDSNSQQIQDRARYGLAQVLEMLGKVDEARSAYGRVRGDLTPLAEARAEQLESEKVKAACEWLATADLPERETPSTSGATSGVKPNFAAEAPAPMPTNTPISDSRSLEQILSDSTGTTETNRYGEEGAEEAEEAATGPSEEAESTSEEEETEKPASGQ
jgi:hypothetical protein